MISKSRIAVSALLWAMLLVVAYAVAAHAQTGAINDHHAAKKGDATQTAAITTVTGGGTAGQVTKWTGAATIGDSGISEDKYGKVGIGTTAPENRLQVAGAIESTGARASAPAGNAVTLSSESTFDALQAWANRPLVLNAIGNNVGIGTTAPTSKLTVAGVIETTSGVKFPDGTVQTTAVSAMSSPPLQPFAKQLSASFLPGAEGTSAMFTVPAGKRLVIETVSLLVTLPFGQIVESFTITTSVNGQMIDCGLFPSPIPQSGSRSIYGITQPLKIYADAGTQVTASIFRGFASQDGGFNLSISGYLVDAQ